MTEDEREKYLYDLDEELLKGSVLFSPWSIFLILESDKAFIKGVHLAAMLTAMAGIETQLRFDHSEPGEKLGLAQLIDHSSLSAELKRELHELRRFRNKWVHISDPWDESLVEQMEKKMEDPDAAGAEIEPWALRAVTALRQTFYWFQGT